MDFLHLFLSFTATLLLYCALLPCPTSSASAPLSFTHSISPNFTASASLFIDNGGSFLLSPNSTFQTSISNLLTQNQTQYYFSLIHASSATVIWVANPNHPVSASAKLSLTTSGLTLADDSDAVIWSTPPFDSQVQVLLLQETGNMVLLDERNVSLWESFDYPTDAIVIGQRLPVGKSLVSVGGDYRFTVTGGDAVLQWNGMSYWKLSMEVVAYRNSNEAVSFMAMNGTGLYLFGSDGSTAVIQITFNPSNFRIAKLGSNGRFSVSGFGGGKLEQELAVPVDDCRIPLICGKIRLCSTVSSTVNCLCPMGFHSFNGDCVPLDVFRSLPSACNGTGNTSTSTSPNHDLNSSFSYSYMKLGPGVDYFAINFMDPVRRGVNFSVCQDLCSMSCFCLGIFHENSSGDCFLLEYHLGSFISSSATETDSLGYIKVFVESSSGRKRKIPIAGLVLLASFGFLLLIIAVGLLLLRRNRISKTSVIKLGSRRSNSSTDFEIISIPGLPVRFGYGELAAATDNFKTEIGSGGFGIVYKGTLPDNTIVAVKKITSLGVEGKREFCTEIAVIGSIHHVNLVRLKGFCTQGRERFLVYEYMNRGSLDRTLFGNGGPVLEWRDRFEIALGTARGLAYLHSGCENKILHCDVKPENILLHENLPVKISDFGLSKLLTSEESNIFTTLRGTRGYLAPEWLTSFSISDKTDVYSYGMVLLEIVRGRKNYSLQTPPISSSSGLEPEPEPIYFPLLALKMHEEGRYLELADPRLEGRVTSEEVEKLVRIALCCVHQEIFLRPTMANVVGMLEGGIPLGEPRPESLNFLRFYGRILSETSTMTRYNEQHDFILSSEANATHTSTTSATLKPFSYISSQVSGPR